MTAEVTDGNWLTVGTPTESTVPFTCSANTAYTTRTATVTLSYTGATDKVVTVTQAAAPAPALSVNPTTAQAFTYVAGSGPSDDQTFEVTGTNLVSADITATVKRNKNRCIYDPHHES